MIPAHYMALFQPLDGIETMLEFGNKRGTGGAGDLYKSHFLGLGIRHVSVDLNGLDGALALDLRKPLGLGQFDMVSNIGTSEHVDDQRGVWENVFAAARKVFVSITPAPENWPGHGLWYPSERFFHTWARANGFDVERLYITGPEGRQLLYCRLARLANKPAHTWSMTGMTQAPPRRTKATVTVKILR